ncbi:hypothetical protein ACLOJK_000171 [Asimina triloba]
MARASASSMIVLGLVVALVTTCELARGLKFEFQAPAPGEKGEETYLSPCWEEVVALPFCSYQILGPVVNPKIQLAIQPDCCRVVRALKPKECWPLLFTPLGVSLDHAARVAKACGSD